MSTTDAAPSVPHASTVPAPQPVRSVNRVLWRWHFFAGLCIGPILAIIALTGALFLFSAEIQDLLRADLVFVAPTNSSLPYSEQVQAVVDTFPEWTPVRIAVPQYAGRSTGISLKKSSEGSDDEQSLNVYVDPANGKILGSVDPAADPVTGFFTVVLKIHRQLFIGTTGRVITELATCWGMILFATGLALWWPRRFNQVRGTWWPRWAAKPYTLLRDLHAIPAALFVPVLLVMTGTGLFYTLCWGTGAVLVSESLSTPQARSTEQQDEPASGEKEAEAPPVATILLDDVTRLARERYPNRQFTVDFPSEDKQSYSIFAINDFARGTYGPMRSDSLVIDATTGEVTSHQSLAQNPQFWWHGWVYPLHAGSIFGVTTKVLWLCACLILMTLPVTGLWMWWQRRPAGASGFPKRQAGHLPTWLIGVVTVVCCLLPMAGVSVLLVLAADWGWQRRSSHDGNAGSTATAS